MNAFKPLLRHPDSFSTFSATARTSATSLRLTISKEVLRAARADRGWRRSLAATGFWAANRAPSGLVVSRQQVRRWVREELWHSFLRLPAGLRAPRFHQRQGDSGLRPRRLSAGPLVPSRPSRLHLQCSLHMYRCYTWLEPFACEVADLPNMASCGERAGKQGLNRSHWPRRAAP